MTEKDIGWKVSLSRADRRKSKPMVGANSEHIVEVIEDSLEKSSFDEGVL